MNWIPVATVTTANGYTYTPIVNGTLFKLKHIKTNPAVKSLKIVMRQAFEDEGVLAFYDYKLIAYKTELDIVLFSLPNGLTNRKLAIKRVDDLLQEDWTIEIEQMQIIEEGVNLPINISDVTNLQQRLDSLQAELTLKATDIELDNHVVNTGNPHQVTVDQIGAEVLGTTASAISFHESTVNHPIATNNNKGMMSSTDKGRLDNMANNSTFNESNGFLLNRLNHSGEQPISSITNLINTLTTFVSLTGSQIITGVKSFNNLVYLAQHLICNSYIAAQNYYLGNSPLNIEVFRTASSTNNLCTDIGYFDIPSGGVCFRLSLIISDSSFSLAKAYIVVSVFASVDTGWLRLIPLKENVLISGSNCEIDIRLLNGKTYLRIRRSGSNEVNGTAVIRLEFTGSSATYFEQTYATTIDNNVVGTY